MSKVPSVGANQSLGNNANAALNKIPNSSTSPKKDGTKPLAGVFAALRKSKQHKAYKALGEAKGNGSAQKNTLTDEAVAGTKASVSKDGSSKGFNPKGPNPLKNRAKDSTRD